MPSLKEQQVYRHYCLAYAAARTGAAIDPNVLVQSSLPTEEVSAAVALGVNDGLCAKLKTKNEVEAEVDRLVYGPGVM